MKEHSTTSILYATMEYYVNMILDNLIFAILYRLRKW